MEVEQVLVQGGALGVILAAFAFILRWVLTQATKSLRQIEKAQYGTTLALVALSQQLLAHDLTVTGLNPSTGVDFETRDSRAFAKYSDLMSNFEKIRDYLEELSKDREK